MWIPGFSQQILNPLLEEHELKNCKIVIDGQNFFYNKYQEYGLPYYYGCDSDVFAERLRKELKYFQDANIECYFIFKGGVQSGKIKVPVIPELREKQDFISPVFMKAVYKEVLEEMGFNYVVCQFESKKQCLALAQHLNCPILSNDIEFCFSQCTYISYKSLVFTEEGKILCSTFSLDSLKRKYRVTDKHLVYFIMLTDILTFERENLYTFLRSQRVNTYYKSIYKDLLKLLARSDLHTFIHNVCRHLNEEDRTKFLASEKIYLSHVNQMETLGVPARYIMGEPISFETADPQWFEKAVALNRIPKVYIDLYFHKIFCGSWCLEDDNAEDALLLSMDIISYVYNILTGFRQDTFEFRNKNGETVFISTMDDGCVEPFKIEPHRIFTESCTVLMDNFLNKIGIKNELVNSCSPESLLLISLAYFARKKANVRVDKIAFSVLLCKVMLDFDSFHDNLQDLEDAKLALRDYFETSKTKWEDMFDVVLLHPLVEFQHCLSHINNLNKLLGSPYRNIIFKKTYNGTFVYKLYYDMLNNNLSASDFIKQKLNCNKVLACTQELFEKFNRIIN